MSTETKGIFKTLDSLIFDQIKEIRSSEGFEKLSEGLRGFSEKEQLIINQVSNLLLLIIPFILVIGTLVFRFQVAGDLEMRNKIETQIKEIKQDSLNLNSMERSLISTIEVEDKRSFVSELKSKLSRKKISRKNIDVDNFDLSSRDGTIGLVNASISYKNLTVKNFSDFLSILQVTLKSTITDIKVTKNEKSSLLNGSIKITLFTKAN